MQNKLLPEQVKKTFIDFMNVKASKQLSIPGIPDRLLNFAIFSSMKNTINDKPLYQELDEYHWLCYIYQQWKWHYSMFLNTYSEKSSVKINIGSDGITQKNIYDHRQKFEDLFSEIDALQIFEPIDY